MQKNFFKWDEFSESVCYDAPLKVVKSKKKKKHVEPALVSKIYCPHSRLIFKFKETLSFSEQTKYRKFYQRKPKLTEVNVVLLQDIKDLAIFLISSPLSYGLIVFLHLPIVDRFLRALILYMQSFLATFTDLGEKRAATAKLAPNPLAGGARVRRAEEMCILRWVLAREYADILMAYQKKAKKLHHLVGGEQAFCQSRGEQDLRIYEGLIQFSHCVVWIALERKQKELIEVELDRLFRTNAFNMAKRKYSSADIELDVPNDEYWILYGPQQSQKRKILKISPLNYEVLFTEGDHRLLSLGLTHKESNDPRIRYLQNAITAKEEDLPKLGIKVGILGLARELFDLMLISQASEDETPFDDTMSSSDKSDGADQYEVLLPDPGSDLELTEPYSKDKIPLKSIGNEKLRNQSKKMWLTRESQRTSSNDTNSSSIVSLSFN